MINIPLCRCPKPDDTPLYQLPLSPLSWICTLPSFAPSDRFVLDPYTLRLDRLTTLTVLQGFRLPFLIDPA